MRIKETENGARRIKGRKDPERKGRLLTWPVLPGLFFIMLGILFLSGCSNAVAEEESTMDGDRLKMEREGLIVVGVSQVGSESLWRTANSDDIQATFTTDNGYFLIFDNARQKQENQIKAIRKFISLQVDYIIFSPISESGWETVLTEAKEAGIPVILMDRKIDVKDEELYTCWVGSDFKKEGINAALWLETMLDGKEDGDGEINIVVLKGTEGASSELGRTSGFEEVASRHENWHILEQVDAEYTTAKGKEEMKRFLETYPDIDVLVSQNDDMTFGAIEAIREAGLEPGMEGDIIIISFDATKKALEMVGDGQIDLDVECNPLLAEKIHWIIMALENKAKIEKEYNIEEKIFARDDVEEVLSERKY